MITFKRNTPTIDTTLANTSKYLNQMQFTGITEENNLFVTDQQSARDAVNVYTDIDGHFVSRPTLQKDKTIDKTVNDLIENYNHKLVELYSIGIGKLYITVNTNDLYSAIIVTEIGATYELSDLPKYHISIIEHYVICFNNKENVGAQVFDTNEPSKGWQSLLNFAEIPVIKRVVGSQETLYEKNNFTESYKEEYIWSNNSRPNLPEGYCNLVEMKSEHTTSRFSGSNINVIPEYAIMKELPIKVTDSDLITCAKNRICIAYSSYFLFSVNNGRSFTYIYYPDYQGRFLNIASISEDGQYFFFVTSYAVYRCNLGDLTWSEPIRANSGNLEDNTNVDEDIPYYGRYNTCCFLTGDIFSFYVYNGVLQGAGTARLYFKGPGLFSGKYGPVLDNNDLPVYKLNYIELDNVTFAEDTGGNSRRNERETAHQVIKMYITQNLYGEDIAGLVAYIHPWAGYTLATGYNLDSYQMHYLRGETLLSRGGIENSILYFNTILSYRHLATLQIFDSVNTAKQNLKVNLNFLGEIKAKDFTWYNINSTLEFIINSESAKMEYKLDASTTIFTNPTNDIFPLRFTNGDYLDEYSIILSHPVNGEQNFRLLNKYISDTSSRGISVKFRLVNNNYFYLVAYDGTIYTNNLLDTDIATLQYVYRKGTKFLEVPQLSYSDTELYLAFNNTLRITSNNRKGVNILFNLPKINDQSFIEPITGLINISTTEVAIFFENKIVVCSKQSDELLGFRYDYYNTKLSTGIRLGDSVINTLEGAYTIFPTKRGLAIMNYQAFMATTDQVITYITDVIKTLWNKFFDNSTVIKIIQWRNILVFTNNTKEILLYDLDTKAWWRWEVPLNCQIALSDQIKLQLIKDTLLVFEDAPRYYDFSKTNTLSNGAKVINWYYQSQPLHFSAPNHYKNLKQLVFQFYEDSDISTAKTMLAQIKLYRKRITQRAPETIKFKIEEYRTFVKRFNYWKINELQWALANDIDTSSPMPLKLNGINIKYEIGEEVR